MCYSRPMCRRERGGHLHGNIECLAELRLPLLQAMAQGLAFDELCRDEVTRVYFPNLINGKDVRMIQVGGGASFLLEAAHAFIVFGEIGGQQFERNLATEPRILG